MKLCTPVLWLAALIFVPVDSNGQRKVVTKKTERTFQFSLAPGLGSNGLQPGGYSNHISVNVTSGYSNASLLFELGGISNLNQTKTQGLQIAGITNITGANAFAGMTQKEREEKVRRGFEANLVGMQISGLANVVINNSFGAQISGGANVSKGALAGLQLAGLSNTVNKYSFGVQVAGLSNVSHESMDGVQLAGLMNFTSGGLYGVQIGALNKAGTIQGINSADNDEPSGVQLGLFNMAGKMNGFQIGLINYGKRMQGTQLGLINIYNKGKDPATRDGTSIGLLNFGDVGYLTIYSSELFALNYEFATGNAKNRRITSDKNVYFENSITYSKAAWSNDKNIKWSLGYGLKKMIFNRSTDRGMNDYRFFSYGADVAYVNHTGKEVTSETSIHTRLRFMAGTKLHPKLDLYFYGGLTINAYWNDNGESLAPGMLIQQSQTGSNIFESWPGFTAGVMIH